MNSRKALFLGAASVTILLTSTPVLAGPALQAAVLPSSRSTTINTPVTIFASMINGGDSIARGCSIGLRNANLPLSFAYQAMEADNATPATTADTPVDVAAGASQAFVLTFNANAPMTAGPVRLTYSCADDAGTNVEAPVIDGVNALQFSASATPSPDVLTIAQSPSGDGYIRIPTVGGAEAMAISAVNIGSGTNGNAERADLIAMPDTGGVALPINLFVCETDNQGACLATPSTFVHTRVGASASTYTVFANADADAGIADFPDLSRVYLRFYEETAPQSDQRGDGRGATGLAVTAPSPARASSSNGPEGIWEARFNSSNGSYHEGLFFVSSSGDMNAIIYGDNDRENGNDHNGNDNGGNDNGGNGDGGNGDGGNGDGGNGDGGNGDGGNGDGGNGDGGNGDGGNGDGGNGDGGDGDGGDGDGGDGGGSNDQPESAGGSNERSAGTATLLSGNINTDGAGNWSADTQALDLGGTSGSVSYQLGGSWAAHSSMNGTYVPGTGATVAAIGNGSIRAAYSRDYDRNTVLADLRGNFDFYDGRTDIGDLAVSSDGAFSGVYSAPGSTQSCTVSGSFAADGANTNLYSVTVSLQSCDAAGNYNGAATLRSEDDDRSSVVNPILGVAMSADNAKGLVLDLFPQGRRRDN
jgi:hypothetical protein